MKNLRRAIVFLTFLTFGCSYTIKIKDGRTAFERQQFAVAAPLLEKEFSAAKAKSEKGKLAFLLGQSFEKMGQIERAGLWFQKAADNQFGPEALKMAAFSLKKQGKYAEAAEAFKETGIEIGSPYEFRKEIAACKIAADWLKNAPFSGIEIEAAVFNSAGNDFSPTFFSDGRLVFSSDRPTASGKENYRWTGQKFMDIFAVGPSDASPQAFEKSWNTLQNEGSVTFSSDFSEAVFVRSVAAEKGSDVQNRLFSSQKEADLWQSSEILSFQKDKIDYRSPAISRDGKTLVFASNDPDGLGGFDLFLAKKNQAGEWIDPAPMPRAINTAGNELFATFDRDTLYFSSDGHMGMGGLDLFKTWPTSAGWAPPQNLRAPMNSGFDDFGIAFDRFSKLEKGILVQGFFTSNRMDGRGGDDIFRIVQKTPPPKPLIDSTKNEPPKIAERQIWLDGFVLEKIFKKADDPNSGVLGRRPLDGAETIVLWSKTAKKTFKIGADGQFRMRLEPETDYEFTATKTEYLSNSARFSTRGLAADPANPSQNFEIEIVLDRIFREREITLDNIYYDYDRWEIRPDAQPTLNALAEVLKKNPLIKIELGSHTDCRGNEGYNLNLSQKRAESAVDFLRSKGLESARLRARGFGETAPAASCNCSKCSETAHQMNRRTTFRIVD